jgi:GGDEF domain-containing protein
MDITTLRKFLNADKPETPDLVRLLQLLLQGIAAHAIESDRTELKQFRLDISNISDSLTERSGLEQMHRAIEGAVHSLEEYNRRASRFEAVSKTELQTIVRMMTDTIAFLGASSETAVRRLQLLEKDIEETSAPEGMRRVRLQLADCLAAVRNESALMRDASQARIASLEAEVDRSRQTLRSAISDPPDPATGLPGRATAEQLIANKIVEGRDFAIALFVVDRIASINARFGRVIGDQILLSVAQYLGQELANSSSLLRWSGPAFVVILPIEFNFPVVEQFIKRLGSARFQKDIETDGGSVMLAITCSWVLQPVTPRDSVEMICRTLDGVVAARAG